MKVQITSFVFDLEKSFFILGTKIFKSTDFLFVSRKIPGHGSKSKKVSNRYSDHDHDFPAFDFSDKMTPFLI